MKQHTDICLFEGSNIKECKLIEEVRLKLRLFIFTVQNSITLNFYSNALYIHITIHTLNPLKAHSNK